MIGRRGFLGMLAAAVAGATLDPEKLLWQSGRKLISIPKPVLAPPGICIRVIRSFDPKTDRFMMRMDACYGLAVQEFAAVRREALIDFSSMSGQWNPEYVCKVLG